MSDEVRKSDRYQVLNLTTGFAHGTFQTLHAARGCVEADGLHLYEIWCGFPEMGRDTHELEFVPGYVVEAVTPPARKVAA